jgi:hypothetical protein
MSWLRGTGRSVHSFEKARCEMIVCMKLKLLLALVVFSQVAPRTSGASKSSAEDDCGAAALYTLLRTQGKHATLNEIRSALPPPSKLGHSMAELRDAAGSLGVDLVGVQLARRLELLDRPALVLLKSAQGGHFVVVRPVGTHKRLLQIIDSRASPEVGDAENLLRSPAWTGMALVPKQEVPMELRIWAVGLGILAGMLIMVVFLLKDKWHNWQQPRAGSPSMGPGAFGPPVPHNPTSPPPGFG